MSTDLSFIYYPKKKEFKAKETISALVEGVASWLQFLGRWSDFTWCGELDRDSGYLGDVSSVADILKLIERCDDHPRKQFYLTAYFTSWRKEALPDFQRKSASMRIQVWGSGASRFPEGDINVEGMAKISILAKPYWAIMNDECSEEDRFYNQKTAENLADLLSLFRTTIEYLQPSEARIVVDRGWSFPWNSHCTYFAEDSVVFRDLQTIREVWETGLWYERDQPLRQYDADKHGFALSQLRSKEQRQKLWERVNASLPHVDKVTIESIHAAKRLTTKLDVEGVEGGWFVVYDRPYFLNYFVDEFYTDVLEIASWPTSKIANALD